MNRDVITIKLPTYLKQSIDHICTDLKMTKQDYILKLLENAVKIDVITCYDRFTKQVEIFKN